MAGFLAPLAIAFVASAASGAMQNSAQAKTLNAQARAEGQSAAEYNLRSIVRNHYMVGMANMQLGLTKRQLAQQGADVAAAGLSAKGVLEANIGASGAMGASAEAARADIQQKVDAAGQTVKDEWEMALVNYNNDLDVMKMDALNNVAQPRKYEFNGSLGSVLLGSALNVAGSFAGNYMMQSMRLNLGNQQPQSNYSGLLRADYKTNIPNLNYIGR